MNTKECIMQALRAHLAGERVQWTEAVTAEEWEQLFSLAAAQNILPIVYTAVHASPAFSSLPQEKAAVVKRQCHRLIWMQTTKTREFLSLYQRLSQEGVTPLVVKGLICRTLYPVPDYRLSSDEDLYLPAEQFSSCQGLLLADMQPIQEGDGEQQEEVSYYKPDGQLYIELHKSLFPHASQAYGAWNRLFDQAFDRSIVQEVDGVLLHTMGHTDHLLYLLCHSLKHFIHSGFGIRQVCDIVLYANAFGSQIDWEEVWIKCRRIHGEKFAAALFQIGQKYLDFSWEKSGYPPAWRNIDVDCEPMLSDLLDGGVYGGASMSRKHSSTITLNAVAAKQQGKAGGMRLRQTIFPPRKALVERYGYLKRRPWLLPAAWISRLATYRKETREAVSHNCASESIKIGSQRVELLKQYGVL